LVKQDLIIQHKEEINMEPLLDMDSVFVEATSEGKVSKDIASENSGSIPVLDSDSVFFEERQLVSTETFYCVLCGTHKEITFKGGEVVLHFLKPTIVSQDGLCNTLKLPIPPLIPKEYKDSTILCVSCVERNSNRDALKPIQQDVLESRFSKLPVLKSFQNSENQNLVPALKRTGYQKIDPAVVKDQIRNSPVHHSLLQRPLQNYVASPLRNRLKVLPK
jgi:hypothetical protein